MFEGVATEIGNVWRLRLRLRLRLDENEVSVSESDQLGAVVVGGGVGWVRDYEIREGVVGGFEEGGGELWLRLRL